MVPDILQPLHGRADHRHKIINWYIGGRLCLHPLGEAAQRCVIVLLFIIFIDKTDVHARDACTSTLLPLDSSPHIVFTNITTDIHSANLIPHFMFVYPEYHLLYITDAESGRLNRDSANVDSNV